MTYSHDKDKYMTYDKDADRVNGENVNNQTLPKDSNVELKMELVSGNKVVRNNYIDGERFDGLEFATKLIPEVKGKDYRSSGDENNIDNKKEKYKPPAFAQIEYSIRGKAKFGKRTRSPQQPPTRKKTLKTSESM